MAEIKSAAAVGGPLGLATLLFGAIGIFPNMDMAFHGSGKRATCRRASRLAGYDLASLFVRLKAFVSC